jgi:hypothetical protein
MRLSKAELEKDLETISDVSLMGAKAKQLTPQQKKYAREVAKGKKKVDAYRAAYPNATSPATLTAEPYRLAAHPRVAAEIAALEAAERAQAYRTPSRLRALVVETLAQVATDTTQKTSDRLRAAQLIGQITEVAAFTERKEVRTISSSEAARAKVLDEIKSIMAGDDSVVDVQAKSLLDELASGSVATPDTTPDQTGHDTGPEYASAQVIDSIRDAMQDGEQSAENPDLIPPKQGETLWGVSSRVDGQQGDEGQDGDPTVPHPPES